MRVALLLALGFLVACTQDIGHVVNIAPSAAGQRAEIERAVSTLNRMLGEPRFLIVEADSGERHDDEIVIREADFDKKGHTERTLYGVIVQIEPDASARTIAHELCHAAGLGHSPEPRNLMYRKEMTGHWSLTDEQLDTLR